MTTTSEAKQAILDVAAELGITMTAEFVPWSKSRSAGEKSTSLNWKVSVWRKAVNSQGKALILTTDYMVGCGHCPGYKQSDRTEEGQLVVRWECENGRAGFYRANTGSVAGKSANPILPDLADVLSSLASEADALNYSTYEERASDLGYDADSRKGEAIYRACLETALKKRNGIGEDGLKRLQEACRNY